MTIHIDNVKEPYKEIFKLLTDNKNKKVSTVLKEYEKKLTELITDGRHVENKSIRCMKTGKILAIWCYYHKRWELLVGKTPTVYGRKKTSVTGYNYMCNEGTRLWRAKYKEYSAELLKLGSLSDKEFAKKKKGLLAIRNAVDLKAPNTPVGYSSYEDAIEALKDLGFDGV